MNASKSTSRSFRGMARVTAAAALLAACGLTHAATVSLFGDRSDFLSALGGGTTFTQDFEGYADGTNLSGVSVLPGGVSVTTNLANLEAFLGSGDTELFATSRNQPEALYDINVNGAYHAFGFDIDAFNPATPGPGFLNVYFADGDLTYTGIPVLPTNATESDPIFFGVISDSPITRIVWSEGPEIGGINCCEETALDNFIAAQPVPEPSTWALMLAGGGLASVSVWRRRLHSRE